jgi:hypothetical protein
MGTWSRRVPLKVERRRWIPEIQNLQSLRIGWMWDFDKSMI